MKRLKWGWMVAAVMVLVLLSGCGGPKADVTIFMMHEYSIPSEAAQALEDELNAQLGGELTVNVVTSSMYNLQKLVVEIVAAQNHLFVLPLQDLNTNLIQQGGSVPLEEHFDKELYPEGVMEGKITTQAMDENGKKTYVDTRETHLFALPSFKLPMLQKHKLINENFYVSIPTNSPNVDRSLRVLKLLEGKTE